MPVSASLRPRAAPSIESVGSSLRQFATGNDSGFRPPPRPLLRSSLSATTASPSAVRSLLVSRRRKLDGSGFDGLTRVIRRGLHDATCVARHARDGRLATWPSVG